MSITSPSRFISSYQSPFKLKTERMLTFTADEEGNTSTRSLGLLVARGTLLVLVSPVDGSEEIENPFVQADDDD